MKVNKYDLNDKVNESILTENKFRKVRGHYTRTYYVYNNFIKLSIMIDLEDMYIGTTVSDVSGGLYAPFYNNEVKNNRVAHEVIRNYNKIMNELVSKNILKYHDEDSEIQNDNCIQIKYVSDKIKRLKHIDGAKSDWVDLRAAENVKMKKGDFKIISLGVAMKLPEGYEAHVVPRSSTFKNFGVIQTNHMGVIDESYCGDNDIWCFPALAIRDTEIHINDRICQFRIMKKMPQITFKEVKELNNKNRGGFGSTGRK